MLKIGEPSHLDLHCLPRPFFRPVVLKGLGMHRSSVSQLCHNGTNFFKDDYFFKRFR